MPIPLPCTHLRVTNDAGEVTEIEVLRCDTDGVVVVNHPTLLRVHGGHKLKQPVILTASEEAEAVALWQELMYG